VKRPRGGWARVAPIVVFVALTASVGVVSAAVGPERVVRGTAGDDTLRGGDGKDRLLGYGGNDRLLGGKGDDVLVGGPGGDVLIGGPGDDTVIGARDSNAADSIACGPGHDTVEANDSDRVAADCEDVRVAIPPAPPPSPPSGESVVLVDKTWVCDRAVDLDLVKVTLQTGGEDAVRLRAGCSGRIGRIEVDTWQIDGIKVNPEGGGPTDLVIEGGYVACHARRGTSHQDGIQVMGGTNITFRNLIVRCQTAANAQLFIAGAGGGLPVKVVCERCNLGPSAPTTFFVRRATESGARYSVICRGRFFTTRFEEGITDLVDVRNTVAAVGDQRCE